MTAQGSFPAVLATHRACGHVVTSYHVDCPTCGAELLRLKVCPGCKSRLMPPLQDQCDACEAEGRLSATIAAARRHHEAKR